MSLSKATTRYGLSSLEPSRLDNISKTLLGGLGLAAGVEAYGLGKKHIEKQLDKGKMSRAIAYAKSKHPELRRRSDKDLGTWMQGVYAISPKVATSNALAASALLTVDSYNGNFDLATAKVLSDINKGARGSDDSSFSGSLGIASQLG